MDWLGILGLFVGVIGTFVGIFGQRGQSGNGWIQNAKAI
jgi:hypothetical protein